MGTQVTATSLGDTKPNYTVATVAAGSVAVADGEFASFVGADITDQVEAFNGLRRCKQALRDIGWPDTLTTVVSEAIYDVVTQAFTDTITEDTVAVIRGSGFANGGFSLSAHATRQADLWLESTAKAA